MEGKALGTRLDKEIARLLRRTINAVKIRRLLMCPAFGVRSDAHSCIPRVRNDWGNDKLHHASSMCAKHWLAGGRLDNLNDKSTHSFTNARRCQKTRPRCRRRAKTRKT